MHHFQIKRGELYAEGVSLSKLADTYGTPLYVYSTRAARSPIASTSRLTTALAPSAGSPDLLRAQGQISNLAVLKLLAQRGSGFDLVSGGELTRVLKAGGQAGKCSFAGVGKTRDEIEQALAASVYRFQRLESIAELEFINRIAAEKEEEARLHFRPGESGT